MSAYVLVKDSHALKEATSALARSGKVALDLECASGLHHYEKRVCLIQLASDSGTFIVDALAGLDVAPLKDILENPAIEIVMHDADFDMRSLDREYGIRPRNIFDTLIAARLCGHRQFGLASMLEHYFHVKSSKRFQRADWTVRPLPGEMLEYAAQDVAHLIALRDILEGELKKMDRIDFAMARFAERELIRHEPDDRPAFARVKGAKEACDGRALAVLKELAELREGIAKRLDLPPFRVMGDETLLALACRPPFSEEELRRRRGMHPHCRGRAAHEMMAAIQRGRAAPRLSWPVPPGRRRRSLHFAELADAVKSWRAKVAAEHGLEPDLILSMNSIKDLAHGEPFDKVMAREASDRWRSGNIRQSLRTLLKDLGCLK